MICRHCGYEMCQDGKYCEKCGAKREMDNSTTTEKLPIQKIKKTMNKTALTSIIIVGAFAVVAFVLPYMANRMFHTHTMGERTIKEATCMTEGLVERYCIDCKYVEESRVPVGEHDWIEQTVLKYATCTKDGRALCKCSVCGVTEEQTVHAEHSFSGRTCFVCGYEKPLPEISVGMSKSQVERKWGAPISVEKSTSSKGTTETWWYKENGKSIAVNFDVEGDVWLITQ